jgi:hypothetical protein
VRHLLGRVGEDDAIRVNAQLEYLCDLALSIKRQNKKKKKYKIKFIEEFTTTSERNCGGTQSHNKLNVRN